MGQRNLRCLARGIRNLARAMGKDHKVGFLVSAASARINNTDNLPQLVMTVGAMGGHMGKSGHMTVPPCM